MLLAALIVLTWWWPAFLPVEASGALRFAWPALWFFCLAILHRPRLSAVLGFALLAGLSLESASVAPFGATLGPLLLLAALWWYAENRLFDPSATLRFVWSVALMASFFFIRAQLSALLGGADWTLAHRYLGWLIVTNSAGFLCVLALRGALIALYARINSRA